VVANQAAIARVRGDLERARSLLDESAGRFARAGDERGQADVLVRRAYLELAGGSLSGARACLEPALSWRQRLNDRRGVGLVLTGLGLVDTMAGDHDRAELELAQACDLFRRAGDRWGLATSLWRSADLAFARDRVDDAEAALVEAHGVLAETRRDRWIAHTLVGLAEVAARRGEPERAAGLLGEARVRYVARRDAAGVEEVDGRLAALGAGGAT
jgi:tetratricopeptide (TPR) repeat protein